MRRSAASAALIAASLASLATSRGGGEWGWSIEEILGEEVVLDEQGLHRVAFEVEVSAEALAEMGTSDAELRVVLVSTEENAGTVVAARYPDGSGELAEEEVWDGIQQFLPVTFDPWLCDPAAPCITGYELELEHVDGPAPGAVSWDLTVSIAGGGEDETEPPAGASVEIRIVETE